MKRPNFFIIGAPKCGTTSMAAWLAEHPQVYMSPVKEPFYFCTDVIPGHPRRLEEYQQLFSRAQAHHEIVAEATTSYLSSRVAVPNVLEYASDARFLVLIRNPLDMAYALHAEMVFQGDEHVRDFERAWNLQDERRAGRSVSRQCRDPRLLLYGPYCRLGEQIERLFSLVPRERVCVIVLDDIKDSSRREYQAVLEFLGLPDDGRAVFPVYNESKIRRFPGLVRIMRPVWNLRQRLGPAYRGLGILRGIDDQNRMPSIRRPMSNHLRARLRDYFCEDVNKLSELLGRDLTTWLEE